MKSLIFAALLLAVFSADIEECLKQKCPNEYNACKKEVFGCAAIALKCKQNCGGGTDQECMKKCALDSGNQKLIEMEACGEKYCKTTFPYPSGECDIVGCTQLFNQECLTTSALNSIKCALGFMDAHPECQCAL